MNPNGIPSQRPAVFLRGCKSGSDQSSPWVKVAKTQQTATRLRPFRRRAEIGHNRVAV